MDGLVWIQGINLLRRVRRANMPKEFSTAVVERTSEAILQATTMCGKWGKLDEVRRHGQKEKDQRKSLSNGENVRKLQRT